MGSDSTIREQAIILRLEGKSYGQILKLLNISSKGTLSGWFKHVVLTSEARRKLERNISLATKRGLLVFNEKRSKQIEKDNAVARAAGRNLIGPLTSRELLLIGAALYWGEGTKSKIYPVLTFT